MQQINPIILKVDDDKDFREAGIWKEEAHIFVSADEIVFVQIYVNAYFGWNICDDVYDIPSMHLSVHTLVTLKKYAAFAALDQQKKV